MIYGNPTKNNIIAIIIPDKKKCAEALNISIDELVKDNENEKLKELIVKDFEKLANQMLSVPFKIVNDIKNITYNMKYSVGFIGCDQNKKNEVFPVTGWLVEPSTKDDEDKIL